MKQTDARGRSPVHIAAEEGNMDMMRALTQSFIEHNDSAGLTKLLSLADRSGNTPLHLMVFNFQHKTSANNSKAVGTFLVNASMPYPGWTSHKKPYFLKDLQKMAPILQLTS